jgi:carbon-monoxide dehydrogenase large subunit
MTDLRQIGRSVSRPNARRLVEGKGRYVADRSPARLLHSAFVRSPYPHAEILSIDLAAARAAPGVVAVYDGAEMAAEITPWSGVLTHMAGMRSPLQPALAVGRTHWQGEPVAMVVAASRALAEDAATSRGHGNGIGPRRAADPYRAWLQSVLGTAH